MCLFIAVQVEEEKCPAAAQQKLAFFFVYK